MAISKIDSDGITAGGITADSLDIGQIGGRRNIAYNGAMNVWQRGTSADTATTNDYMCDRWQIGHSGLDGNVDWDQETASTPDGFGYALKVSTDASETSLDAGDYLFFRQKFEGQDLQQLQKGTSGSKSLTVSFWVKSSVASTYTVELEDADNTRTISKSYAISSADTWEFKTVTFEGDTTGALDNDNGDSLRLYFWIDAGSNFTSGTFSTAWQATSNSERVYDTTGWLESTTPTFFITGVQLEVGSVATPFEHRSYGEELLACQRYLNIMRQNGSNSNIRYCSGICANATAGEMAYVVYPELRSTPALGVAAAANYRVRSDAARTCTSVGSDNRHKNGVNIQTTVSGGQTSGFGANFDATSASSFIELDAEL